MMEISPFQFQARTQILFGLGSCLEAAAEFSKRGVTRVFIVCDSFWRTHAKLISISESLKESGVEIAGIFSEFPADGSVEAASKAAELAKKAGTEGFLALGGGSALDMAKAINLLTTCGGDLKNDYSGAQTVGQKLKTLIALPTTCGTGSEVTSAAVLRDDETGSKLSFMDDHLMPDVAVLDPTLLESLPPRLVVATAFDALTHACEAIWSLQANPVSEALALAAIRRIYLFLPEAVAQKNHAVLGELLMASTLAGMAFNNAMVGVVHALAHSVGAISHVHHGEANGLLLVAGFKYNAVVAAESIQKIATIFNFEDVKNLEDFFVRLKSWMDVLRVPVKSPITLSEAGVKSADIPVILALAEEDGAAFYNPRPVVVADLESYFLEVMS